MNAQSRAATWEKKYSVQWFTLERDAFSQHPFVLKEPHAKRKLLWVIPLVIVYVAGFTAPIWGAAAIAVSIYTRVHPPSEERILLAGTFFVISTLFMLVCMLHWAITRNQIHGLYRVQAGVALVLGTIAAVSIRFWGLRDSVESWHIWVIPAVVTAVLSAVFLILMLIVRDPRSAKVRHLDKGEIEPLTEKTTATLERRRERIAQLSDDELAAITRDLHAAIDDLENRGLVTSAAATTARSLELGALSLRMPVFS